MTASTSRKASAGGACRVAALALALLSVVLFAAGCTRAPARPEVVVYTTVDEVDARKVLAAFEEQAGIKVLPLFDTEASKTTGMAMRLMAEKDRPRADVFWSNELSRTLALAGKGVFAEYRSPSAADIPDQWKDPDGRWASFSLRARVIVYNTDLVSDADAPKTLDALCDPRWKGKVGIANPLFGTTACQAAALAYLDGEDKAVDFFTRLKANGVRVYEGNSVVRDVVAAGEIPVGLTDTDDALIGVKRGMKIAMILPGQGEDGMGTLVIPNSVALVAGAPRGKEGRALVDFLLSREVERRFADPSGGQIPVRGDSGQVAALFKVSEIKPMRVDWQAVSDLTAPFSAKVSRLLLD